MKRCRVACGLERTCPVDLHLLTVAASAPPRAGGLGGGLTFAGRFERRDRSPWSRGADRALAALVAALAACASAWRRVWFAVTFLPGLAYDLLAEALRPTLERLGLVREYQWACPPQWAPARTAGTCDDAWSADYSVGTSECEWTTVDGPPAIWTFAPPVILAFALLMPGVGAEALIRAAGPLMTCATWVVTLARPPPRRKSRPPHPRRRTKQDSGSRAFFSGVS